MSSSKKTLNFIDAGKRMVVSIKEDNRRLADALQDEKRKSRVTIAKLLEDAEVVIEESNNTLKHAKNIKLQLIPW